MSNTPFTHREDAERHSENYGGVVMDNRHSAKEWNNNNFTVAGDRLSDIPNTCAGDVEYFRSKSLYGYVRMTREEHEAWMLSKGWSESIKGNHRKEFTGAMDFDDDGRFEYVNP